MEQLQIPKPLKAFVPATAHVEMIQELKKELEDLALNYDPYQTSNQAEMQTRLKKFHLDGIHDPFTITNKLLVLLDEAEQLLKQAYAKFGP